MKILRIGLTILLIICLLSGVVTALSEEKGIDLSAIQSKEGFHYGENDHSVWSYYAPAYAYGSKGEEIEFMLVSWGEGNKLSNLSDIRFFAWDANNKELKPEKATMLIGSNMFELELTDLGLDNVIGSYARLVLGDEGFIRSLASGKDCSVILQCSDTSIEASFSKGDLDLIRDYAVDMLRYDFLSAVNIGNKVENEAVLLLPSVIKAHIFEEINIDEIVGDSKLEVEQNKDGWKEYSAKTIGVSICFPSEFDVYTRNMSDDDPAAKKIGLSGAEITDMLTKNDIYIDAFDPDDNEIFVTMKISAYQDFSSMTDESLLSLASMYPALSGGNGMTVSSTEIYRNGDLTCILYEGNIKDTDGHQTNYLQYNTASMGQLISFVLFNDTREIGDQDRKLMASIMEHVSVSKTRGSQSSASDEWQYVSGAEESNQDEFEFKVLDDGTASIKKYKGNSLDIVIPSSLDGHVVSSIAEGFSGNNTIRSIRVSDGIKSIDLYAFSDSSNLIEAWIPDSVIELGSSIFSKCEALERVRLSSELTELPRSLFYDCVSLTRVNLPEKLTLIGNGVFERCYGLTDITIPSSVTVIEGNAFRYCTSLTNVIIPEGVESIGSYAFKHCTGLLSITIPGSVKEIGKEVFDDCPNLIITVERGSYAEKYCDEKGIQFTY